MHAFLGALLPRPLLWSALRTPTVRSWHARRVAQELRPESRSSSAEELTGPGDPAQPNREQAQDLQSVLQQQEHGGEGSRGERAAGAGGRAEDLLGHSRSDSPEGG